jgi:hypothetical protein
LFAQVGGKDEIPNLAASITNSIKIDQLEFTDIWGERWWERFLDHWKEEKEPCNRADPHFRDEFMDAYRDHQIQYPPDYTKLEEGFRKAMLPLQQRAKEMVFFAEFTEELNDEGAPEFLDVAKSFKFVGNTLYSQRLPTLAANTTLFARMRDPSGSRVWCCLPAAANMALTGWPLALVSGGDETLLRSFAGNAFSAFSIGSILMGVVATMDIDDSLDDVSASQ